MVQEKNKKIAHISNRGDAVQKTANPSYHKEIKKDGMIYSIYNGLIN